MSVKKHYMCDYCKSDLESGVEATLRVSDGVHPHNGSRMFRCVRAHICVKCLLHFTTEKPNPVGGLVVVENVKQVEENP